jgi:hypothetical protein
VLQEPTDKEMDIETDGFSASPKPASPRFGTKSALHSKFEHYDTNGDGVLDEPEVAAMMLALGFNTDTGYLRKMLETFGQFDKDLSGKVCRPAACCDGSVVPGVRDRHARAPSRTVVVLSWGVDARHARRILTLVVLNHFARPDRVPGVPGAVGAPGRLRGRGGGGGGEDGDGKTSCGALSSSLSGHLLTPSLRSV